MAKTAWMIHLDKVYKDGKKKDKEYKYSQAMKDAKKTYTKKGNKTPSKK
jgi:hypothetical protein|tara:strand:- start:369 stop:515 length:147 start_codon:yes stop_codon:yes gene_type:complete